MKKRLLIFIFRIFLLISIIVLIRFSDLPVIKLPFKLQHLFIKPQEHDGIWFNLSLGYIVSVVFYWLVVYFPEKIKKDKVFRMVNSDVYVIYKDVTFLVLLLYKNICNESDWNCFEWQEDTDVFTDAFYNQISKFDVYSQADTRLCKKEPPHSIISWCEKLENDLQDYVDRIDVILNRYIIWLDDTYVDDLLAFRNSKFITSFLGIPSHVLSEEYSDTEGMRYRERVPYHVILNDVSGNKKSPIFQKTDECDNVLMFRDFINSFLNLKKYFIKMELYKKRQALDFLCKDNNGHFNIARVKE